jgi:hypothetical protein
MLPKLPPGRTRLASSIRSSTGLEGGLDGHEELLLDRDEDRTAHLAFDGLGEMALAVGVLDQEHLTGADDALLAVARGDLDGAVEIDDVLPAGAGCQE